MTQTWQEYLAQGRERFRVDVLDLLRIPSISTDPAHAGEVRRGAQWAADRLRRAGIEHVQIMETTGHPVVYGDWLHAPGRPTVLFYGHFDVQPVDPLDLWTSPPFEPVEREGKLFARGAADMKASLLLPAIACEALLATEGTLPVNVKFLWEAEEEIGSPSLPGFIASRTELLACDTAVNADGGNGSPDLPISAIARRGLASIQINVRSAQIDMHSGAGGAAPNSIHALVYILDSMRDAEGRITVPGFYDDVRPLTEQDREQLARYAGSVERLKQSAGFKDFYGEPEFTAYERTVVRPTLEVNGIWGGYQGPGSKTVIPAEAHAKITCRLVPDQRPERIEQLLLDHIRRVAPPQVDVTVEVQPGSSDPYLMPDDHFGLLALDRALAAHTGKEPLHIRWSGTVPVLAMLKKYLDVYTVTLGCTDAGGAVHAPNEFIRMSEFDRMQPAYCLFLKELGR